MEAQSSRMSLIDLDVQLCTMQYGKQENLEQLHELITNEFESDKITYDELVEWASYYFELEELERSLDYQYPSTEILMNIK